jgi:hypothetical protein
VKLENLLVVRVVAALAPLATFVLLSLSASRALADEPRALPAVTTSAVVRVEAYERISLGAAVGDGRLVIVPFDTVEIAHPRWPKAVVYDAEGGRHDAGLAATDRASGLAILAVEHPLTATPLTMSPHTLSDVIDTFAITKLYPASGPLPEGMWTPYAPGALAAEGRVPGSGYVNAARDGSPILDIEGRLVAMMKASAFSSSPISLTPAVLARLDGTSRTQRSVLFYGGVTLPFSFAPSGGLWFGLGLGLAARVNGVLELRADAEFSAQVAVPHDATCQGPGACYSGIRGVLTHSIGYRHVLGGVGSQTYPIAVTPSLGLALGVQDTHREYGASAYDAATPSTWAQPAPGLALSLWILDLRGRLRIPLDAPRAPTIELSLGATF